MSKAVSTPFSDAVQSCVARDPEYAAALLAEAVQCSSRGEASIARANFRDVIKGSIGYAGGRQWTLKLQKAEEVMARYRTTLHILAK
jgi:hypothetical protein